MGQNSVGEETHLAIETSGHGALKENHWLDDGAYLMVNTSSLLVVQVFHNCSSVVPCCQYCITPKKLEGYSCCVVRIMFSLLSLNSQVEVTLC